MTKIKLQFCCQSCGSAYSKWSGQCTNCGGWNTIAEEAVNVAARGEHTASRYQGYAGFEAALTRMSDITLQEETARISTGSQELDRVLGGGLIRGSAVLIGGDPGIGKSTLLLQAIAHLSQTLPVLYVTGEESPQQVTLRARRLGLPEQKVWLLADTHVENILTHVQTQKARELAPAVLIIDSIQTMHTGLIQSAPGSVSQVRESAMQLVTFAKQTHTALFIVGHVTKEGHLAGPRVLEHMVDTVLYFEGEQDSRYRMIRAVKNRFGAVNELGIFAMTEKGLRAVSHPSAIFLSRYETPVAGSVITATKDGTRPLLVEVQALVDQCHAASPRRLAMGLDTQRLAMLLAILHRHSQLAIHTQDVFVNVVGGLQIYETAADLAILFAILSSFRNRPLPPHLLIFGEVGLAGEIRPVPGGQERLKEAGKHGFKVAIVPNLNIIKPDTTPAQPSNNITVRGVQSLKEALQIFDELI